MIRFCGGPAHGKCLDLRRAPLFLRVVIDKDGTVDALDQVADEPSPTETTHVYVRNGDVGRGLACTRGKGCIPFVTAEYHYSPDQPTDEEIRDNARWQAWAGQMAAVREQRAAIGGV